MESSKYFLLNFWSVFVPFCLRYRRLSWSLKGFFKSFVDNISRDSLDCSLIHDLSAGLFSAFYLSQSGVGWRGVYKSLVVRKFKATRDDIVK